MLTENEDVISFYPGGKRQLTRNDGENLGHWQLTTFVCSTLACKDGNRVLGRIVVHDRARVESQILPRYFNHASFASLRRQLNYFSFTRIGKGRQRGATYSNEGVIELNDILMLKRRSTGSAPVALSEDNYAIVEPVEAVEQLDRENACIGKVGCTVPVVHLPPPKKRPSSSGPSKPTNLSKKARTSRNPGFSPSIISHVSTSPITSDDEDEGHLGVVLDLTVPASRNEVSYRAATSSWHFCRAASDEDIMAGCNALLAFSNRRS